MTSDDNIMSRHNFKCEESISSLNVKYNQCNSMLVFWNKNQIFIYDNLKFPNPNYSKYILPQYHIHDLLVYNNYIVCLDINGSVHIISLKFKNTNVLIRNMFSPLEQNVIAICNFTPETILFLKQMSDNCLLSIHKVQPELQPEKKILLSVSTENFCTKNIQTKCILKTCGLSLNNFNEIKSLFHSNENILYTNHNLLLITFDRMTIYGAVFNNQTEQISLQKIYLCPSLICNIEVNPNDLQIVVALNIGTIIKFNLNTKEHYKIHLNTAIHKMIVMKDTLIYTDGLTMWRANLNNDGKFKRYFARQVYDFVIIGDQIICTTFMNIIYSFSVEDYKHNHHYDKSHILADIILSNSECLNQIFEEIENNSKIAKKIKEEETYISCIALANRLDIMNEVFQTNINVYTNYDEVQKAHSDMILTEKLKEYFEIDTILLSVELSITTVHHTIKNILTNLVENLRIYTTLSSGNQILKTVTIKVREYLKTVKYLIPLKSKLNRVNVNIKLVVKLPGVHDKRDCVYTVLYTKNVLLTAEHFIKIHKDSRTICLKQPNKTLQKLVQESSEVLHGNLFNIHTANFINNNYSFYVKLPNDYKEIFKNETYCKNKVQKETYEYLSSQYNSDEFLKSKSKLNLEIGDSKIVVEVVNDGFSEPLLKISGGNMSIGYDIRNFFAKILYDENNSIKHEVNHTFYTTVENLQKTIKNYIFGSFEDFTLVFEQFERNIIGGLPF